MHYLSISTLAIFTLSKAHPIPQTPVNPHLGYIYPAGKGTTAPKYNGNGLALPDVDTSDKIFTIEREGQCFSKSSTSEPSYIVTTGGAYTCTFYGADSPSCAGEKLGDVSASTAYTNIANAVASRQDIHYVRCDKPTA